MNTRKRLQALALVALGAGLLAAVVGPRAASTQAAATQEPRRQLNVLPPAGVAEGQTLRVNFLNAGDSPVEIIPCIFDGDGAHLKTGEVMKLLPGQTRSLELSRAEAGRREERSVVVYAGVHCDGSVRKGLVVSGEVVEDATGRSGLFVPGLRVGFDPQPDPPATP